MQKNEKFQGGHGKFGTEIEGGSNSNKSISSTGGGIQLFYRNPNFNYTYKNKKKLLTWCNIPMQKPSIVYKKIHPVSWDTTTIVLSFFSKEHKAVITSSLGAIHV